MSKGIPLLAHEKIKLVILIAIAVFVIVPGLFGQWQKLYRVIVRDKKGYERSIGELEKYYNVTVGYYDDFWNRYGVRMDPQIWKAYDDDQRFAYCDKIYDSLYKTQQRYKMRAEGEKPEVKFYLNELEVANIKDGLITLKQ